MPADIQSAKPDQMRKEAMNPEYSIRLLDPQDVPAACSLCRIAGWNQLPGDWKRFIRYESNGCFAAIYQDNVIGTVTTTTYGTDLGWIGMMLVHPDHRRRGVASALMKRSLEYLTSRDVQCVRLDASPDGQPVYERLGFLPNWSFHRWCRLQDSQGPTIEPSNSGSLSDESYALDTTAFGCSRKLFLESVCRDSVIVSRDQDYGMMRAGFAASYIGPVVARTLDSAESIVQQLLQAGTSKVFWDIPGPNNDAEKLARKLNFNPVRTLTRMTLGTASVPADISLQYALVDPGAG